MAQHRSILRRLRGNWYWVIPVNVGALVFVFAAFIRDWPGFIKFISVITAVSCLLSILDVLTLTRLHRDKLERLESDASGPVKNE